MFPRLSCSVASSRSLSLESIHLLRGTLSGMRKRGVLTIVRSVGDSHLVAGLAPMPTCSGLLLVPLLTDIIATSITHIRTRLPTYLSTALFYRVVCSIITLLGSSLRCDSDVSKPRVKLGPWAGFKHLFRCRNQSRWGWGGEP